MEACLLPKVCYLRKFHHRFKSLNQLMRSFPIEIKTTLPPKRRQQRRGRRISHLQQEDMSINWELRTSENGWWSTKTHCITLPDWKIDARQFHTVHLQNNLGDNLFYIRFINIFGLVSLLMLPCRLYPCLSMVLFTHWVVNQYHILQV